MFPCILCLAVAPPEPLAVALEKAVVPLLAALSTRGNESAWSFAYKDADLEVQFCAGPIMRGDGARKCHGKDTFAWGSTTKPITAVMLLQLAESGLLEKKMPIGSESSRRFELLLSSGSAKSGP